MSVFEGAIGVCLEGAAIFAGGGDERLRRPETLQDVE